VAKFFHEALRSTAASAALASKPRMDVEKYWEKRRVQSLVRRLLEALQERFSLESEGQASDLARVFDALVAGCPVSCGGSSAGGMRGEAVTLDQGQLCSALEAVNGWPPDVTSYDRLEMYSAILVPSLSAARAVLSGQERLRTAVTCRAFCDGLDRVPFNLPDFPVPVHNLPAALSQPAPEAFTTEQTEAVAQAVATTFCMDRTGLDKVKDYFLCGLISLEEIQRALPKLVPHGLVEDAVARIIRRGAPLFSMEEWEALVVSVRVNEAAPGDGAVGSSSPANLAEVPATTIAGGSSAVAGAAAEEATQFLSPTPRGGGQQTAAAARAPPASEQSSLEDGSGGGGNCLVSLASPLDNHRQVAASSSSAGGPCEQQALRPPPDFSEPGPAPGPSGGTPVSLAESPSADAGAAELPRFRGRFEPVTEPLPCRELLSEDPVNFIHISDTVAAATANAASAAVVLPPAPQSLPPIAALGQAQAPTGAPKRVVDWSTASSRSGAGASSSSACPPPAGWHQADEGAGARLSWGTSGFKRELELKAAALAAEGWEEVCLDYGHSTWKDESGRTSGGVDHLAWINLNLHHELGGPYLATAFVLCCQIYERRRLKANAC